MKDIFFRVETTYNKHKDQLSDFDIIAALTEELGEYSRAVRVENKAVLCTHKKIKESSKIEICDLILVAMEAFICRGGDYNELLKILNRKILVWENLWKEENENT